MIINCHLCKKNFEVKTSGIYLCPHCGTQNICGEQTKEPVSLINAYVWEDTWKQNFLDAITTTLKNLILNPILFFRSLSSRKGFKFTPVIFFIFITQGLGVFVSGITNIGFSFLTPLMKTFLGSAGSVSEFLPGFISLPIVVLFLVLVFPLLVVVGLFVSAAVNHLFILIFIKNHQPFEETLKLVGYCQGVNILMVIPILGGLAASIGQVVLLIMGVREVHKATTAQAVMVVLFPYLLCCGIMVSFFAVIMSFIFSGFFAL